MTSPSHLGRTVSGVRAALVALGLAVAVASSSATAPAASQADAAVFGGLGTWIDIYDGPLFAAPERTAARIAARGVKVVWIETANDARRPTSCARRSSGASSTGCMHVECEWSRGTCPGT